VAGGVDVFLLDPPHRASLDVDLPGGEAMARSALQDFYGTHMVHQAGVGFDVIQELPNPRNGR
jgi:hypothetical protein